MKAAFFDIDGTIYREGLIKELFKKILVYEIADKKNWYDDVKPAFMKWDTRRGEYDDYLEKMVNVYIESIIGVNKILIDYVAKKVIEQKGGRVYTFTRDKILEHKKNGDLAIAISGSPLELVSEMAKKYEFDSYKGTEYIVDENNIYTGDRIPMWDAVSKKAAILDYKEKYNLNLAECFAYGDTTGDFTMFKLVGHPFAINPTKSLIKEIMEDEDVSKKITIIVERKDMIYTIPIETLYGKI